MSAPSWDQAKSAAMAVLGNKAKIPDPKANWNKYVAEVNKVYAEYKTVVTALQAKILSLQNVDTAFKNVVMQFKDQIDKTDFGLDEDEDGVKAKIEKAQKILEDFLDAQLKTVDANVRNLDELDKHTMSISKYKPPAG